MVDPDVIVFSGGMARAGDALLSLVHKYMRQKTWTVLTTDVELCAARSIESGGMLGAALAAKRMVEKDNHSHKPDTTPIASTSSISSRLPQAKSDHTVVTSSNDMWSLAAVGAALLSGIALGVYFGSKDPR